MAVRLLLYALLCTVDPSNPCITPYYWPRFCNALGRPEWAEAEEYSTPSKRGVARVELGGRGLGQGGLGDGLTHSAG